MKKFIYILIAAAVVFVSYNIYKMHNLFKQTDYFVEQLNTTYSSYGLQGTSYTRYTNDGKYKVAPVFRLINVRIEDGASEIEYEILRTILDWHYTLDRRVNDVYICGYGTIMIDCRH
jgi:hypothetical protein